jgi:peptidyl-prolyl cis-trans isomerase A (cyclophilin A)
MRVRKFQVVTALVVLAAGEFLAAQQTKAPASKAPSTGAKTAKPRASFDPALLNPAALKNTAPQTFQVRFTTTQGDFVIKVTRAWAPLGADRFYNLCKHHFYNGASLFRVLPGFVVQFGIHARPEVSKVWGQAAIKDDPVKQSNKRGYVTYAMGGPNTRTTQVFVNLADKNVQLDAMGFSPFGEVVEGMDVVEKFYSTYGERASNHQDLIESQGKAYLDANFPKLDSIKSTTLILPEGSAAGKAPGKIPGKAAAKKSS